MTIRGNRKGVGGEDTRGRESFLEYARPSRQTICPPRFIANHTPSATSHTHDEKLRHSEFLDISASLTGGEITGDASRIGSVHEGYARILRCNFQAYLSIDVFAVFEEECKGSGVFVRTSRRREDRGILNVLL